MNAHRSEHGQALVLIIFAIVGVFGFIALAVDGGKIYSERRRSQNAADAAALSAAYAAAAKEDPVNAAWQTATANGFDGNGETNTITINNPPVSGPYEGDPQYYQVVIWEHVDPIFSQFVFSGQAGVTSEAVAHSSEAANLSSGDAMFALNPKDSSAMNLSGNTGVAIDGGNIRSNGGMVKNGASGDITVNSGSVYYGSTFSGQTSPFNVMPQPDPAADVAAVPNNPCPTASEANTWPLKNGFRYNTFNGVDYFYYPSGLNVSTLTAGIHCIQGGIGKGDYTGKGVLLVLLSGGIKQTGNDSFDFRSARDLKDRDGNQWGGMLFYVPSGNTSTLDFGGNSIAYLQGVLYAPTASCDIGGTSDGVAYHTAIICKDIKVHGNPTIQILYKPEELFHFPPSVELSQ
jgi:hypothetical protein